MHHPSCVYVGDLHLHSKVRERNAVVMLLLPLLTCLSALVVTTRGFYVPHKSALIGGGRETVTKGGLRVSEADIEWDATSAKKKPGLLVWGRKRRAWQQQQQQQQAQKALLQGWIRADVTLLGKLNEYSRGGMTAPNMVSMLKKRVETYKDGVDPAQVIRLAAPYVSDAKRRALLLETFDSQNRMMQAASMSKFSTTGGSTMSAATTAGSSSTGEGALGGVYVFGGGPRVSSGKSGVLDGVRIRDKLPVKIKLSRNTAAISREAENLRLLRQRGGRAASQAVVRAFDYFENYDGKGSHALVLEAGQEDVTSAVKRQGALDRRQIKRASRRILSVLAGLSSVGLVWTDLTPGNLIMVDGQVKAIDLESAVPVGTKPVDCTPDSTPPEVARFYLQGRLTQAVVAPSYDVWSFGTVLFFMATGKPFYYDVPSPSRVMQVAATLTQEAVDERVTLMVKDAALAKLLTRALQVDPSRRATATDLLKSWYYKRPW